MHNPELTIYHRRLPHWRLEGSTYFVTWRLHHLQQPLSSEERELVKSVLLHFDVKRYSLFAWVVMDNHVHVLFSLSPDRSIKDIVHSWKSYSSNELGKRFNRQAPIWQGEYFDRIVRNEAEFLEKGNYILNNPRKRWTGIEDYPWVGLGKDF